MLDGVYGPVPERMRTPLERIQSNGKHLLGLINDILDLSKIEAGQLSLSLGEYSVDELVRGVYRAVESLAAEKKLAISTRVPPDLPPARGDERRLAQALLNLVGNAIKFTDRGEIAIEVETNEDSYTFWSATLAPASPKRIKPKSSRNFDRWTALSRRPRWARAWVLQSQSALWKCTAVAFGSIQAQAQGRRSRLRLLRASTDRQAAMKTNKTILVVEDQEDNRQILRDLLGSAGFRMIEAHDGEQALVVARSQRPDLILMDIQLPLVDGYEATRSIKRDPELRHIPVIAVTSYALSGDEQKAREAGCDAYVAKPYSTRHLLAKIDQYLEQPL
jgi:CheY-like chemotaxis protein